jgi:hypothetical protein
MREFLPGLDWDGIDERRRVTKREILSWIDSYHAKHRRWPTRSSGAISGTAYTWRMADAWLRRGGRGLPPASSLAKFLTKHRGARPRLGRLLSERQILAWADAHFKAHGEWPTETARNGSVLSPGDTWKIISSALYFGSRGLSGGSSLAKLLRKHGRKK